MLIVDPSKKYYRGNTHTHTTVSDGRKSPEECMEVYASLGHDFLAITAHWKVGEQRKYGSMTVLKGVEYDFPVPKQALHLVALFPGDANPDIDRSWKPQDAVRRVNELGGCVILAHPAWSLNTLETMLSLEGVRGAEIFNAVSGMPYGNDRSYSGTQLDLAATYGMLLPQFTGDDTHYYNGECGMGVNMVQADSNAPEDLIAAMKRGSLYCTQGPVIHRAEYDPETRKYTVDCSDAWRVAFYSDTPWAPNRCVEGENLTHAEYQVLDREHYIRCEVIDRNGKRAFLPPVKA